MLKQLHSIGQACAPWDLRGKWEPYQNVRLFMIHPVTVGSRFYKGQLVLMGYIMPYRPLSFHYPQLYKQEYVCAG